MAQERNHQTPRYNWQHYTKAGAIFVATTATYLLARTTGALDSLWHWGANDGAASDQAGETLQSAVARVVEPVGAEVATIAAQGEHRVNLDLAVTPIVTDQATPSLNVVDWSERELPATELQTPTTIEPSTSNIDQSETDIIDIPSRATSRRLLQTSSDVTVVSPIPDQVIDATKPYQYDLSKVFAGNYTLMTVTLTNGSALPSWLDAQYSLGSYDIPGSADDMEIQDGIAYVAYGSGLQVLNVSNPLNITRLGSYDTPVLPPRSATYVQVQNGLAYVIYGYSGLEVLNISNPSNITRLGSYDTPGGASSVQVQDGVAYVADGDAGLQVLNISNPSNITRLGSYDTPGQASRVQVQDGVAYVADGDAGLQVLNVNNPLNITHLASYDMPDYASDVQVQNGLAYVADGYAGLQVLNVNNPLNITHLASYGSLDYFSYASDVQVENGLVYVVDRSSGLQVINMRQGQLSGTPTAVRVGESYIIRVSACDQSNLVAYEDFQLSIARFPSRVDTSLADRSILPDQTLQINLDSDVLFSDPSSSTLILSTQLFALTITKQLPRTFLQLNPIFLGSYDHNRAPFIVDVQVQNGLAYVADSFLGLQVLDVSNPAAIIQLGSYDTLGQASSVQVQNEMIYVADRDTGLQVLNASNPRNITRLGSYDTPGSVSDVQVQNGVAYVADWDSGLQVLDVTNPSSITRLGSYDTPGSVSDVQVQNGVAYVADWDSGLQVLNVSNPRNIIHLGSYDTPGSASDVRVQNGVAYVADSYSGLQVLNVSNPRNITRLGSYDTPDDAQAVQIQNGLAYVADGISGLQVLDVSNPLNITLLGSYKIPGRTNNVQIQNNIAYVGGIFSGLQVLDLTEWQWNIVPSSAEVGNYRVTITATNELGGTASDSFGLRVEGGPQLNSNITIPQLFAKVGVPFNYFIPQGLLSDPNNDPISFTASLANNSTLPSWLSFNEISATFSGLAQSSNVGNYSLRIIATDNVPGTINAQTTFSLYVDNLPYVNQRVADQVAGVGLPYHFTVPSSTFIDPDNGDILSYSTRQRDGSALPSWLIFNSSSRRYLGTPSASDIGSYNLVLIANDGHNGEAQAEFSLLVENFPQANLNQTLIAPVAGIGQTWSMNLPPNSFTDADDTQLIYQVTRADGTNLPSWLSFNPFSSALLGVPLATDLGVNALRVTASDPHGGSAYRDFNLTVVYFPSIANAIPKPPTARILRPFNFTVPSQTFNDLDSPVLIYNATLSSTQPLPAWLNFDAQNLILSGTPNLGDEGTLNLLIRAQDMSGGSIGAPLDLVIQPNFPPQLTTQVSNQVASVLQPFNFFAPAGIFQDPNGDSLGYSAQLSGGGLPAG
jgi:hypothetical protein